MEKDIRWLGSDILTTAGNDADTVSGRSLLEQSIALLVSEEIRKTVSTPLDEQAVSRLETRVNTAVERDRDISTVQRLDVTELDKRDKTLSLRIVFTQADTSTITVNTV